MAKFIVAEIIDNDKQSVGYRIFDSETSEIEDCELSELVKMEKKEDSFSGFGSGFANADIKGGKVVVRGFDKKPIRINRLGEHVEGATHIVCGFNPMTGKVLVSDFSGNFEKMDLSAAKNKAKDVGLENVSNADIFEMIEEREKKEEANKPKCVYVGGEEDIEIPSEFKENELTKELYGIVNSMREDIIGAYILNTNTKAKGKYLKLNDNGTPIEEDNYLNFDVCDVLAEAFILLESTTKQFVSIPVCEAFKPLIESFKYTDITITKFRDFLDYLADQHDDLTLDDERAVSKIIGGDIVSIVIDNSDAVTVQINGKQPELDYDVMRVNFIVNLKEKKKNIEIVVSDFPWALS